MLRSLTVDNYALIAHLEMELGAHLNTVTGETGAGKSILMGALGLLLGTRSEVGVQGDPTRNCVVEGVFEFPDEGFDSGSELRDFFAENDLEFVPRTTVRRVISTSGKSRAYIGDLPVNLGTLREFGDRLIDIHSQHENLLLRDDRFRTSTVDAAAGQLPLVARYSAVFERWRSLSKQLEVARAQVVAARGDEDYLRHQVEELAALGLRAGEQSELEAEQRELEHADEIRDAIGTCAGELAADEGGILPRLKFLRQSVERVRKIHPRAEEFAERLGSAYLDLQDLERELSTDYERLTDDPERLAEVNSRLDAIWSLERKHRVETVEELLALQSEFELRLAAIDNSDEMLRTLEADLSACFDEASDLAAEITVGRRAAAKHVSEHVESVLRRLGMTETMFVVEVSPAGSGSGGTPPSTSTNSAATNLRPNGADEVRFLFTANPGVSPRPVEKIASGGEISRVMLALKTLSVKTLGQPTVVFDEIDAGVSGRVADAMGEVIAELAASCQVLNITHLPQIAAKSGEHFFVYKEGGATKIRRLSPEERVAEIAKMLSGNVVTPAALDQARELLGA